MNVNNCFFFVFFLKDLLCIFTTSDPDTGLHSTVIFSKGWKTPAPNPLYILPMKTSIYLFIQYLQWTAEDIRIYKGNITFKVQCFNANIQSLSRPLVPATASIENIFFKSWKQHSSFTSLQHAIHHNRHCEDNQCLQCYGESSLWILTPNSRSKLKISFHEFEEGHFFQKMAVKLCCMQEPENHNNPKPQKPSRNSNLTLP